MTAEVISASLNVVVVVLMVIIARRSPPKTSRDRWALLAVVWAGIAGLVLALT